MSTMAPELSFSVRFDSSMICNYIINHLMSKNVGKSQNPNDVLPDLEGSFSIVDNESCAQFGTMSMRFGFDSEVEPEGNSSTEEIPDKVARLDSQRPVVSTFWSLDQTAISTPDERLTLPNQTKSFRRSTEAGSKSSGLNGNLFEVNGFSETSAQCNTFEGNFVNISASRKSVLDLDCAGTPSPLKTANDENPPFESSVCSAYQKTHTAIMLQPGTEREVVSQGEDQFLVEESVFNNGPIRLQELESEAMMLSAIHSARDTVNEYAEIVGVRKRQNVQNQPKVIVPFEHVGSARNDKGFSYGALKQENFGKVVYQQEQSADVQPMTFVELQCDKCSFKTVSGKVLGKHYQKKHGKNFVYCSLCSYSSRIRGNLKKHYISKHRMDEETTNSLLQTASFDAEKDGDLDVENSKMLQPNCENSQNSANIFETFETAMPII